MMRVILIGLFFGSALGLLAATAASVFVLQKPQIQNVYRDQVRLSETRVWEL